MKTRTQLMLIAGALLLGRSAPVLGQEVQADPLWLAYLGCWESSVTAGQWVCVTPAAEGGAVDLVTVVDGQVAARERIAATGERLPSTQAGCPGWESAEWSAQGQRVYVRGEFDCAGAHRATSGLIAMSPNGEWLYIQSVTVGGGQTGVRVLRYREASAGAPLPAGLAGPPPGGVWAVTQARAAAGARLSTDDIVEAARRVDAAVLEAWLAERGEALTLDGKRLVALADAGVPDRVIDLMVALAYPAAFTKSLGGRLGGRPDSSADRAPLVFDPYAPFDYGYGYGSRYGYGYGYGGYNSGWYPGGYLVIIVLQGGGGGAPARSHGRVVNGRGYSEGESAGTAKASPRPSTGSGAAAAGSSGGSGSSSSSGSSSGSSEQRTAKPRPPSN